MNVGNETEQIEISIVTPVYKCCKSLSELYERLNDTLSKISDNYEIIMVNDGSPDDAWRVITELSAKDPRVKGINLAKNFGQHYAISAGLDFADGNWVVVMDCDLQDKPEEILKMYNKALEGYDIVLGRRVKRRDSLFKRYTSKLFYKIYNYFTDGSVDATIANFSVVSSSVVKCFRMLKEQTRFYPVFINWVGFKTISIEIEHSSRCDGKSSYTFLKLFNLAIDTIISQSNKPLKLSIKFGFTMSFLSGLYALYLIIGYLVTKVPVEGWTSVMVSIYFVAGLLFGNLGIIGLYIGKIYDETKGRPVYLIKETTFTINKHKK